MEPTKAKMPAAARPSPFTIHHLMAYFTRTLITKTGESPSTCHRLARKPYALIIALDEDFPGHMDELSRRLDLMEPKHTTTYYTAQARKEIQTFRHELVQARRAQAMPQPARAVTPEGERQVIHRAASVGAIAQQLLLELG